MASIINQEIPEFSAEAFVNGEFKTITSEDVKGKWAIFMFYPADFTFVCPTELEDMAGQYEELKGLGVEVYSVSTDTHFTHKAWHDSSEAIGKVTFPMIGDPTGRITRGFNVMIEEEGLAERGTFVVDPDGKIQVAEIHAGGIGRSAPIFAGIAALVLFGDKTAQIHDRALGQGTVAFQIHNLERCSVGHHQLRAGPDFHGTAVNFHQKAHDRTEKHGEVAE